MPESLSLNFVSDDARSGFRLQHLEVLNWGTFNGQVRTLRLDGCNALLTGDIGSGKSTLVDAVTTLLVPTNRIAYNKAAGADARERTLLSYVRGHYKSERGESSGSARPVFLRDQNSYSVILGVFHNAGYEQTVTLAQVFYLKDSQRQPERYYVCAERALSIAGEFSQFGSDILNLRKRLRSVGCEIPESFRQYEEWFRRRFGIQNRQALELFHQTVSMKSVGNLTDFVRSHMLEPFDAESQVAALITHFDDLNRAHGAVLKAKRQISLLTPLVVECDRYSELTEKSEGLRACREALKPYFAGLKLNLLNKRIDTLEDEFARLDHQVQRLEALRNARRSQQRELERSIAENGGDRIERLKEQIRHQESERQVRQEKARQYAGLIEALKLTPARDSEAFFVQRQGFLELMEASRDSEAALQNQMTENTVTLREEEKAHSALVAEVKSLKARRNNMPQTQVAIRADLCGALGLGEAEMPFVGELLQVRTEERDWEGAAERLLHNFGLSLLVPDAHYPQVVEWVDRTHLKGRLVYYRVRPGGRADSAHPDSLVHKLTIKPESAFYDWLQRKLVQDFDLVCCTTQEQFRREVRAITHTGQIKFSVERHEKDDRHRIDDRSRYILGWTNTEKIAALETNARHIKLRMTQLEGKADTLRREQQVVKIRQEALLKLDVYREFRDLDWQSVAAEVAKLEDELHHLQTASDLLKELNERLKALDSALQETENQLEAYKDKRSRTEQKKSDVQAQHLRTLAIVENLDSEPHRLHFETLEAVRSEALGEHQLSLESCDNREQEMRSWLQNQLDNEAKNLSRLRERIIKAMTEYKKEYDLETREVDISTEAAQEYRKMLKDLEADGLSRFEARFKELLNENTIREVANFQSQLNRERGTIKERIAQINHSLTQIDYNPGRFILLEAHPALDADIRDFQGELRVCTEGSLTGSDDIQYSEAKFLQVKKIIERLRGREGQTEADRRWMTKVTDVRNWFSFAASERWREDGDEHEHYSDSGGKSGGQKEKLAYTVLAASLAYQFGLEWGAVRSRSFRFVVIDEAFGRGSDESAQYGLQLFEKLNLQLLIVTPLQKIHIIEPFVASVGFVHNEEGRSSKIRNLSIEEYRADKARSIV